MDPIWAWVILGVIASLGLQIMAPRRYCKGRITRLFAKVTRIYAPNTRMAQLFFVIYPIALTIDLLISPMLGTAILNSLWIGLSLDDYLTGDDDQWRRFKSWAKNRVKWKMDIPQPVRVKENS